MVKKSPLIQKNIEARISKKCVKDHTWIPPVHQAHISSENDSDQTVRKTIEDEEVSDDKSGNSWPGVKPSQSNAFNTSPNSSDYVKYDEQIDVEVATRQNISQSHKLAEQGPVVIQILAFVGGLAMVLTSLIDFQMELQKGEAISRAFAIISIYTWAFGFFIMGMEGRVLMIEVQSLQMMISNYMKVFRFVWGRGLFYIFAGSLQYCLSAPFCTVCGGYIMILGIAMVASGAYFTHSLNLESGDGEIHAKFDFHDHDHNGYISKEQFKDLVIHMNLWDGSEEADLDNEFRLVDVDNDGLVYYPDFKKWADAKNQRKKTLIETFVDSGFFSSV